jgi:hypothetical protein
VEERKEEASGWATDPIKEEYVDLLWQDLSLTSSSLKSQRNRHEFRVYIKRNSTITKVPSCLPGTLAAMGE